MILRGQGKRSVDSSILIILAVPGIWWLRSWNSPWFVPFSFFLWGKQQVTTTDNCECQRPRMYWLIKAFGRIFQEIFVDKMEKCRPDDSIIWAAYSWLKTYFQRVLMDGGGWCPVTSQMDVLLVLLFYSSSLLSLLNTKLVGSIELDIDKCEVFHFGSKSQWYELGKPGLRIVPFSKNW